MIQATHYNNYRGFAQPEQKRRPETAEERRRRLHRKAAADVKAYAAALREAKERYQAYDVSMAEEQPTQRPDEEPEGR